MKKHKTLSLAGLYITYMLIGYQGPFPINLGDEHHPHTHVHEHRKHITKLLVRQEDLDQLIQIRKFSSLNA